MMVAALVVCALALGLAAAEAMAGRIPTAVVTIPAAGVGFTAGALLTRRIGR